MISSDEFEDVYNRAFTNAMEHGCGFIQITHTPTGLHVDVIEPEEYLNLSLSLQWAAENMLHSKPKQ